MEKFVTLKKAKRARKHGFLSRMKSHSGQKVVQRRRLKGRAQLALKSRNV
jgi:large subunit ribosomal protein L34